MHLLQFLFFVRYFQQVVDLAAKIEQFNTGERRSIVLNLMEAQKEAEAASLVTSKGFTMKSNVEWIDSARQFIVAAEECDCDCFLCNGHDPVHCIGCLEETDEEEDA